MARIRAKDLLLPGLGEVREGRGYEIRDALILFSERVRREVGLAEDVGELGAVSRF